MSSFLGRALDRCCNSHRVLREATERHSADRQSRDLLRCVTLHCG